MKYQDENKNRNNTFDSHEFLNFTVYQLNFTFN